MKNFEQTGKEKRGGCSGKRNLFEMVVTAAIFVFSFQACTAMADTKNTKEGPMSKATFAGGCFWCMEPPFEELDGVLKVEAGYIGGKKKNPTYSEVSSGNTSYMEAIQISYDPSRVSYGALLEVFWRQIDPTDEFGQFADRGSQYTTVIFFHDEEQKKLAEESKRKLSKSGRFSAPIVTKIVKAGPFYAAEEYHQDYYKKNPFHYKSYRTGSGRDYFLKNTWGKTVLPRSKVESNVKLQEISTEDLAAKKKKLSRVQYRVTQEGGTEPAFDNAYWDYKKEGLYVDVVSGEPLFSSTDKFESGTGWPSFVRPLEPENIVENPDASLGMVRVEVKSKRGGSHLGHVFDDGPLPSRKRYCINSASLRFVPKEELSKQGYGAYLKLFE